MSDELQPISVVAPKAGMSPSNLRRLALDGIIRSERDKTGKYLIRLNDVLAHCAAASRQGASKAPGWQEPSSPAGSDAAELAAMRRVLAAREAENERLLTALGREQERVERLEDKLMEMMGLHNKLLAETQAFLAGATGTAPSSWINTGAGSRKGDEETVVQRGLKAIFRK
jgi:DNA-binding transcriptional MerR regulator